MKKYNDEYFSVIDSRTGKKLMDCGLEEDAIAMVALDSRNRTYIRNKFLMSPVIDIEIPKQLPTYDIVKSNVRDIQNEEKMLESKPLKLYQDDRVPINTK